MTSREDFQNQLGILKLMVSRGAARMFVASFPFPDLLAPLRDMRMAEPMKFSVLGDASKRYIIISTTQKQYDTELHTSCDVRLIVDPPAVTIEEAPEPGRVHATLRFQHVPPPNTRIGRLDGHPDYFLFAPSDSLRDMLEARIPVTHSSPPTPNSVFIFRVTTAYSARREVPLQLALHLNGDLVVGTRWSGGGDVAVDLQVDCLVIPLPGAWAQLDLKIARVDIILRGTVDAHGRLILEPN